MLPLPRIVVLLCLFCIFLPHAEGLDNLFKRDPKTTLYRKAKGYRLVPIESVVPGVFIDLRYRVTSAAKRPLYRTDMPCFLHKGTADKLRKVALALQEHGYALKIWDAWRPPEAHLALWDAVQDERFVVPPSNGLSWHCYGVSVDLTLVRLDGTEVAMPSGFDEFSEKAAADYKGGNPEIAARLALLQKTMKEAGFRSIETEWWHFDDVKVEGHVMRVYASDLGLLLPSWIAPLRK